MSGILSKSFSALYRRVSGGDGGGGDATSATDQIQIPLTSIVDFVDDTRRVLRMIIDPDGKFIATADSLGRVQLYDRRHISVVRVWKGLRDAKLAWILAETAMHNSLSLAIYAPK